MTKAARKRQESCPSTNGRAGATTSRNLLSLDFGVVHFTTLVDTNSDTSNWDNSRRDARPTSISQPSSSFTHATLNQSIRFVWRRTLFFEKNQPSAYLISTDATPPKRPRQQVMTASHGSWTPFQNTAHVIRKDPLLFSIFYFDR
ncbi:hypothetical protein RRF57_005434 [Xylaria bambusicola]|uniref:Uncharacterized protein n=1 Tax=Xylaria bambusicola TaxID=326684 RepID=A0AAN7UY24_9PEZI